MSLTHQRQTPPGVFSKSVLATRANQIQKIYQLHNASYPALYRSLGVVSKKNITTQKRFTRPPRGTQMGNEQIKEILDVLPVDGNLLVWGLGNDSPFWHDSTLGRVVFIEDDIPLPKSGTLWYDKIITAYNFLEAYKVHYSTHTVKSFDRYMRNTEFWDSDLDIRKQLPSNVTLMDWDVILVDAPLGCCGTSPGRYQSIYTSKLLSTNTTHIFVDDYERQVEKQFSLKVFGYEPQKVVVREKGNSNANENAHFSIFLPSTK